MRKQNQIQAQAQVQQQNKEELQNQQMSIYFVTFVTKLDTEKTREILSELRRRFPSMRPLFTPVPPPGRRRFVTINDVLVILTFPKSPNKREEQASRQEGFTLKELAKIKKP